MQTRAAQEPGLALGSPLCSSDRHALESALRRPATGTGSGVDAWPGAWVAGGLANRAGP